MASSSYRKSASATGASQDCAPSSAFRHLRRGQISISVTPIRVEHELAPGGTKTDVIRVENIADRVLRARVVVSDWYLERDGTPVFVKRGRIAAFSMSDWIEVNPAELTLRPGETRTIRYTVDVPANTADGGYRTANLIESLPDLDSQRQALTAYINARIGVIVYGRVGAAAPAVEIARQQLLEDPSTPGWKAVHLTLRNTGVVHFRYQGDSQLLDATGAVLATVSVPESVVLPQSERDVVVKFEPRLPASALSVVTRLDVGLPERLEIETRVSAAESGR